MNKLFSRLGILVLLLCCVYPAFSQKWEDWEGDYCSNYTVRYKNNDITGWITYKFNAETHEAYVSDAAPFHTNHLVIPSSVTVEFYNPHNDYKMEYVDCTVIGIGSNDVNTDDIIAVCDFITGNPGPVTKENADVNGDGQVDVGDIIAVTNIITGN